ncbi:MAG TPA: hypothetical protein PKY82_31515 [Pyrinomonadaceae bacterium]|nr:hypothetical protein [Pyrinomonadaceae bacterium]
MNYFSYFSEIEETFIRRRGKNLFLSPLDWALIETWQEREVPLHIILRGIEKVFDNHEKSKKKRTIKSLAFCSEEIEAQYEEWLETQVGKNADQTLDNNSDDSMFSPATIANHLANISTALAEIKSKSNKGLAETLERVLHRLEELKTSFSEAEALEEDLTHLEKMLDDGLLENAEKDLLIKLKNETEKELHTYQKTLEKEVYQRTFDLLLLKKLRLEIGIPRLSLFYL